MNKSVQAKPLQAKVNADSPWELVKRSNLSSFFMISPATAVINHTFGETERQFDIRLKNIRRTQKNRKQETSEGRRKIANRKQGKPQT